MDIEIWIKSINEAKDDKIVCEFLTDYEKEILDKKCFCVNDPKKIFNFFGKLFQSTEKSVIAALLKLVEAIISVSGHDIDSYIDIILGDVIDSLFDSQKDIRENGNKAIKQYILRTRNVDKIWNSYYAQG